MYYIFCGRGNTTDSVCIFQYIFTDAVWLSSLLQFWQTLIYVCQLDNNGVKSVELQKTKHLHLQGINNDVQDQQM